MKHIMLTILFFLSICIFANATNYYINNQFGADTYIGTSNKKPWKSFTPLAVIVLQPGDSILLATGQTFSGSLAIVNFKGLLNQPLVITSYMHNGDTTKPIVDAGSNLYALHIQNSSNVYVQGLEFTGKIPYTNNSNYSKAEMRCGILIEVTKNDLFENIFINKVVVHDVYYQALGYVTSAAETKSANGTQSYGWGIRIINTSNAGTLSNVKVYNATIFNVSHTGLKATGPTSSIKNIEIAFCKVSYTGGPGMQFSGITDGHIHHNNIDHSGSTADSRNWGRGSGLWTWGCSNIVIEHNRFENANGPGDSAGIHIDYNCNSIVVQYNFSANNAGGFCEILGNNFNCAYRYNISVNDGFRLKGVNGAFQEGKTFWLSGYQGNGKPNVGPYNSYFYNNTIYVAPNIVPKIAISSSAEGVFVANNIFYFERKAIMVAGDQKKVELDKAVVPNVVFNNNLFLQAGVWPKDCPLQDEAPFFGDPLFKNTSGLLISDYLPTNKGLIKDQGIEIFAIPNDKIGLKIGLKVKYDILGNLIKNLPDVGAIELKD